MVDQPMRWHHVDGEKNKNLGRNPSLFSCSYAGCLSVAGDELSGFAGACHREEDDRTSRGLSGEKLLVALDARWPNFFFFSRVWPVLVVACGCGNMSHLWPHVGRAAAIRGRLLIEQRKRSSGAGDGPDLARMTIDRRLSDCCETQTMGVGRRWQG
ncbi:dentin sialoph s in 41 species: Archae - 0 [Striga asiatica]|uniref:Dentin sialoph s in 41 species: Archae-0 n=1 Tax=Striga asiatica TaxID=4170 RepID=A0A5A7QS90_STRAF|nr:dentin sialoph s in 41 species: Archae - 0 [Striga asiatica]